MQPRQIKNQLLRDQIYEYIIDMIKNGEVEPGQKLAEQSICNALGVSRTPVREALTRLAAEGIIDKIPRHGFSVRSASRKEKTDSYAVQYALEYLAAELYIDRCTEEMLQEQESYINQMEAALKERDFTQYIQANNHAHLHIVENSGNDVLIESVRDIYMSPIPTYYEDRSDRIIPILNQCIEEHRGMLRCFREKDKEGLKPLYYNHIVIDKTFDD